MTVVLILTLRFESGEIPVITAGWCLFGVGLAGNGEGLHVVGLPLRWGLLGCCRCVAYTPRLILTALLEVACSPVNRWEQLPVAIDFESEGSGPTDPALAEVERDVIAAYNAYFGTEVFVSTPGSGVPVIEAELEGRRAHAVTKFNRGGIFSAYIRVDPDIRNSHQYRYTLAHELGHVLGMDWHDDDGLMAPHSPSHGDLTEHFHPPFVKWLCTTYRIDSPRCRAAK